MAKRNHTLVNSVTGGVPKHHWLAKVLVEGFVALGAASVVAVTYERWVHRKLKAHIEASTPPSPSGDSSTSQPKTQ